MIITTKENPFLIAFDTDIDMREVYYKIMQHDAFDRKNCPNLLPEQKLPDGIDYINVIHNYKKTAVITRKGLSADNVVGILTGEFSGKREVITLGENPNTHPYFAVEMNMDLIYSFACLIACNLNMRCPPIIMSKFGNGYNGKCYYESKAGKTTHIEIAEKDRRFGRIDYAETLAHEMRHCWQHETSPIEYFSNYKEYTDYPDNKKEQYYLQPAEIDARAYALLFINALTEHNYEPDLFFPKANAAIIDRANQIGKLNI